MDDAARRALLAEIELDITRVEGELEDLKRLRAYVARPLAANVSPAATSPAPAVDLRAASEATPEGGEPDWRDLVIRVFRDVGAKRTLRAPEIENLLVSKYGVAPKPNRGIEKKVYTLMDRREDLFVNLGEGQWTLVEFRSKPAEPVWSSAHDKE